VPEQKKEQEKEEEEESQQIQIKPRILKPNYKA
jgi:hypothetical protein